MKAHYPYVLSRAFTVSLHVKESNINNDDDDDNNYHYHYYYYYYYSK